MENCRKLKITGFAQARLLRTACYLILPGQKSNKPELLANNKTLKKYNNNQTAIVVSLIPISGTSRSISRAKLTRRSFIRYTFFK